MRKQPADIIEKHRIQHGPFKSNALYLCNGMFERHGLRVIASDGDGWDHVSVSKQQRCPTWEEMETVREWFFEDDETIVQFSVPRSQHLNLHQFCLHMWRKQDQEYELPPSSMVA